MGRPAGTDTDTCWLLLAPDEVGLLHRLRPAVRAGGHGVLVQLEQAPPVPGAQVGLVHRGRLTWFGALPAGSGLSASDVAAIVDLVRDERLPDLTDALQHKAITSVTVQFSGGRASPRT